MTDKLFQLKHLRRLNHGSSSWDEGGELQESTATSGKFHFATQLSWPNTCIRR